MIADSIKGIETTDDVRTPCLFAQTHDQPTNHASSTSSDRRPTPCKNQSNAPQMVFSFPDIYFFVTFSFAPKLQAMVSRKKKQNAEWCLVCKRWPRSRRQRVGPDECGKSQIKL
jgi:hypothetical protein